MKIIAFSGNSNTGKTSAVHAIHDRLLQRNPTTKIIVFQELGRKYLDMHIGEDIDRNDFQSFVKDEDIKRLDEISSLKDSGKYDYILLDRTYLDAFAYVYWSILNGVVDKGDLFNELYVNFKKSKELYDHVVFFDKPIKKDNRFDEYNSIYLNMLFESTVVGFYSDKIIRFDNNIEFSKVIDDFLLKL